MATDSFLPYARHLIDDSDMAAVAAVLASDWLTTGPEVEHFEAEVAAFCGAPHAVAVSSGTAALHAAMHALGIGCGDEVIVPAMTFAATANCVVYCGATPVVVDVRPDTLLIDPAAAQAAITPRSRAIIAVDYAGQPCDYDELRSIARHHGLSLVADSCHSIGGEYKGQKTGTLADLTVFSFHPVKHLTTGEGGMVLTGNAEQAACMRRFRNHGIDADHRARQEAGTWRYEMTELGFNYRITDFQCALGRSQLRKLAGWLEGRRSIAARYVEQLAGLPLISPLTCLDDRLHAWHLYVLKVAGGLRDKLFTHLRRQGIGANVHYLPLHLHAFYRKRFGFCPGLCPTAERAATEILSLPMHPGLAGRDIKRVCDAVRAFLSAEATA